MVPKLLFLFTLVKSDIADDLFIAKQNQKMGKIADAQYFYDSNYYQYGKAGAFINSHIEFLIWIGDYDAILRKYGHLKLELVEKAQEYINIINSRDYRKISQLLDVSPFCAVIIKACIRANLIDKNMNKVFNLLHKGKLNFPEDLEFYNYEAQYYCLNGQYEIGAEKLENLGFFSLASDLRNCVRRINSLDKSYENIHKFNDMKSLYHQINTKTFSDNFSPSIFSNLLDTVLYKLINMSVRLKMPNMVSLASKLHNTKSDEELRYLFIMTLIFDGQIQRAKDELEAKGFKNKQYTNLINTHLNRELERQEEKKRQQEEQRKKEQQRYVPRTERAGTDFLGYYKLLGVNKDMDKKQIKKAYAKIIAKQSKIKKNEKQKEEWEKKHKTYNKALQVLTDQKKKEMYDNGVDPDSTEAQQAQRGGYHHQQEFKGFDDFGPFAEFFSGFGGRSGGFRQGRRAQYFYFQ